jgi:molecular chaperone DnaJ
MDLYVILGLERGATESDIKRAYRRLARRFHPDINPGDRAAEARFRQILEAYETLIDPARRSRYETAGVRDPEDEDGPRTSGFEGFDFSVRTPEGAVTFGDLFADVLQERAGARQGPERGADLHHEIALSFDEAFAGVSRALTVTRRESCRICAGTGLLRSHAAPCLSCHGSGTLRSVRGHMVFSRPCAACGGSGQQRPRPCGGCAGSGQEVRTDTVAVRVPPGVADGDRLRVGGKGNAGTRGGAAGDLYLTVRVAPHPVFTREGRDLYVTVPVAVHEAALGARLDVPVPEGYTRLRVPPGTQSGHRFRLRERGMPTRDGGRGDLFVQLQVVLPRMLDERSKELLREFGRINREPVRAWPTDTAMEAAGGGAGTRDASEDAQAEEAQTNGTGPR